MLKARSAGLMRPSVSVINAGLAVHDAAPAAEEEPAEA